MYKKIAVLILVSLLFSACQKVQISENTITIPIVNFNGITNTILAVKENAEKKDISEYEDCTAVILDGTIEIAENPIFIFFLSPHTDSNVSDSIDEMYREAIGVVKGTVVDLIYETNGSDGSTFCSFAVSEVLCGEQINPETIITVQFEQGITPLKLYKENNLYSYPQFTGEDLDRTYRIRSSGEPFVKIGEEYVLFLCDGSRFHSSSIIGDWYYIASRYGGTFRRNEDGLYERMIPECMEFIFQFTGSLSLDELKEQIAHAAAKTEPN